MQKTTVNPNPEQERRSIRSHRSRRRNPAAGKCADLSGRSGRRYRRTDARGADRRSRTGPFQAQRLHPRQPRGKRHAERPDLRRIRRGISRCPSRGYSAAGMGVGAAGRLARVRVPQVGDCRAEGRTGSARDEPEEPPCGGRSGAVGRGTHGGRPGLPSLCSASNFCWNGKMENGKWKITAFILHYQLSIFHYCTIEHLYRR